MVLKLPSIIGHRGACGYAPENTLESINTAADMGVEWVEIDVKLTKDDVPIIFHDDTLDRTTNGSGPVAERTWQEIKDLEAGSWFGDSFTGIAVPSLEQAIDVLIDRNLGLNLKIASSPGREKETAEVALDMLSHYWDDHDKLLISSTSYVSLEVAHDMAHGWPRGFIMDDDWHENWEELAKYLHAAVISLNGNMAEREHVEAIIDADYPVLAYTINEPLTARELQTWGVDCILTDVPDVILENILTVH